MRKLLRWFRTYAIAAGICLAGAYFSPAASQGTLIVLNKSGASASLIALKGWKEIARIATGEAPHEVAVSPDGKLAVVTNYGTRQAPGSTLTVIDIPGKRAVKTIALQGYSRPHGIVFLPGGQEVLVTAEAQKALLRVDVQAGEIRSAIRTDQDVSHMVVAAPEAGLAFVANIGSGSVSVIDYQKGKRVKTISTAAGAEGIALTPDGKQLWVTNRADNSVSIIPVQKLLVEARLPAGGFPIRIKFTPDGKHALVSNARSGDVSVFDVKSRKEIQRISMQVTPVEKKEGRLFGDDFSGSPVPVGILIPPDGRYAYVANTNADVISVIDLHSWKLAGRLKAGPEPDGMGWSGVGFSAE